MHARLLTIAAPVLAAVSLLAPSAASAEGPLELGQCRPVEGYPQCSGLVKTWDGVPLDTTVTLPARAKKPYPLVVLMNGFGNSKWEYLNPDESAYTGNAYTWARRGYAVLTFTARGLWGSCGEPQARLANPEACAAGYIHLADVRYEVRDAQELIGRLVDGGYADPAAIGVTGDSYGGGQILMMAALSDRVMLPAGRLVPWRSPAGRRLRFAAAAPVIPWSDLISAAAPNGMISDTGVTSKAKATSPIGVAKMTFVNGIFAAAQAATGPGQPVGQPFVPGRPMGYLAPPGADPEADVARVVARTDAGEPYDDPVAREIVDTLARYRSAYYIDASHRPPPLFMASGFTDDLFPVDEVLRFANRTRKLYPRLPVSLLLGDFGHQRAANKPVERRHLMRAIRIWFERHLLGEMRSTRKGAAKRGPGKRSRRGHRSRVAAYVQTCPRRRDPIGPWRAPSFNALSRRALTVRFPDRRSVTSASGVLGASTALDPVTGLGNGCVELAAEPVPGGVRLRLKHPGARPVTLIGAPRVKAEIALEGAGEGVAQLGARLWDVAPGGKTQRLVARGSYRPHEGANRWFLHPGAWRFERGHAAVLELLGADAPFSRPSNGVFTVSLSDTTIRLPARR